MKHGLDKSSELCFFNCICRKNKGSFIEVPQDTLVSSSGGGMCIRREADDFSNALDLQYMLLYAWKGANV
jgi:hypothetical protein